MTNSIDLIKESISQWADDEEISLTDGQISDLALLKWQFRPNDSTIDCVNHCDEMQRYDPSVYDCDFWEIICPLDLPNRKYCINYSPVEEVNTHD
jgi:hypothetical protein